MAARAEVTAAIRERYRASGKAAKSGILDEFVAVTGVHRKHAIRLLSEGNRPPAARPPEDPLRPRGRRGAGPAMGGFRPGLLEAPEADDPDPAAGRWRGTARLRWTTSCARRCSR